MLVSAKVIIVLYFLIMIIITAHGGGDSSTPSALLLSKEPKLKPLHSTQLSKKSMESIEEPVSVETPKTLSATAGIINDTRTNKRRKIDKPTRRKGKKTRRLRLSLRVAVEMFLRSLFDPTCDGHINIETSASAFSGYDK